MTASEQNGIDILCDAAGSDMLLSSLFSLASPNQQSQHLQPQPQSLEQDQQQPLRHQTPRSQSSSVPSKRKLSDATPSSPSHVCHICKRVYERADHLTRHLRSHENARPYQCSRCPKRFNRADLLTRHETTHDRDGGSKGRPFIRRSDRAAEACLNCAASKAKCEDQKPCSRCRNKSLTCEMPPRRGQQYRTSDGVVVESPSEASTMASIPGMEHTGFLANDGLYGLSKPSLDQPPIDPIATFQSPMFANPSGPEQISTTDTLADDFMFFNPTQNLFQDKDFHLELDLKEPTDPWSRMPWASSPRYISSILGSSSHPDFKLSAWIHEPEMADFVQHDADNLAHLGMDATAPSLPKPPNDLERFKITPAVRDRLFAMVLTRSLKQKRPASFPSLEILNHFLQAHLTRAEARCDSLIHIPSFDPERTSPELLCAMIASGAAQVSAPTAWKFGLALDDVVHLAIRELIERPGRSNWDLASLQAFMLHLDIGQWSGFKRKMETAESSAQDLLTILRRSGKTSFSHENAEQIPLATDPPAVLQLKWKQFIIRQSYKRLVMRLFFHDVQSSIGLSKPPLMSLKELDFDLPASRDTWRARSADEWRDIMLSKPPTPLGEKFPRVAEVFLAMIASDETHDRFDIELRDMALIHGFWGQVWSYRDAIKFYNGGSSKLTEASPTWLDNQYQESYKHVNKLKILAQRHSLSNPELIFLVEVLAMALHVPIDNLKCLSGKNGKEAFKRAVDDAFYGSWGPNSELFHAVWHAGQVVRYARALPPTSLQGLNALAVYFASLILWLFGKEYYSPLGGADGEVIISNPVDLSSTKGIETRESTRFLERSHATPGLTAHGSPDEAFEPLTNSGAVLTMIQEVFRNNFPILQEPMPPFVESLQVHLDDLRTATLAQAMSDTTPGNAAS